MNNTPNLFNCRYKTSNGYCKKWIRSCVGSKNCLQGICPYCKHSSISPKIEDSVCVRCSNFEFKKENYIE